MFQIPETQRVWQLIKYKPESVPLIRNLAWRNHQSWPIQLSICEWESFTYGKFKGWNWMIWFDVHLLSSYAMKKREKINCSNYLFNKVKEFENEFNLVSSPFGPPTFLFLFFNYLHQYQPALRRKFLTNWNL